MAMPRPGVFSVPNFYAKYFGKSNSVEISRGASFMKSTASHHEFALQLTKQITSVSLAGKC
jgi:hypothetical protein